MQQYTAKLNEMLTLSFKNIYEAIQELSNRLEMERGVNVKLK